LAGGSVLSIEPKFISCRWPFCSLVNKLVIMIKNRIPSNPVFSAG
jgi:hypothetical protein